MGCRVKLSRKATKSSKTGFQRNLLGCACPQEVQARCVNVSRVGFGSSQRPELSLNCQRPPATATQAGSTEPKPLSGPSPSVLVVLLLSCQKVDRGNVWSDFPVKIPCRARSPQLQTLQPHHLKAEATLVISPGERVWRTEPSCTANCRGTAAWLHNSMPHSCQRLHDRAANKRRHTRHLT